jgi:hypothetical protein
LPGELGGAALADVLFGIEAPSGRLPVSIPRNAGQIPVHHDRRAGGGRSFLYGDYVDSPASPLFPFGFGLSYTTFRYSDPQTTASGDGYDVGFDVTNTGRTAGATVPQVYLGPAPSVPAGVQQPERALAGFDRIELDPGQTKHETIHVGPGADRDGQGNPRAFQYWSTPKQAWVTAPGARSVWVGDADDPAHLTQAIAGLISIPISSTHNCVSRRRFRITLRAPRGEHLVSARVYVNAKRVHVSRGKRLHALVDLRGLPRNSVTIRVVARTRKGRRVVEKRTYRTCTPRRTGRS